MKSVLSFLTLFSSAILVAQTTHTVDNNSPSGADFDNIPAAIAAAASGDTIYVHPSPVDYGDITLNKVLHIRSLGHSPEYSNGMAASIGNITLNALIGAQGITLYGLRFKVLSVTGNIQNYNDLQIRNCRLERVVAGTGAGQCNNWVISGCVVSASMFDLINKQNSNGWIVVNNHIHQQGASGTWSLFRRFNGSDVMRNNVVVSNSTDLASLFNECTNLGVENSIFVFVNTSTGLNLTGNSVEFTNCLNYSYPGQTLSELPGVDNLNNTDPLFVNIGANNSPVFTTGRNFQLQESSPAAGYGTDGQDLGLYGSDFNWNNFGYAPDLPYPTFMEITNSVVEVGGTLNVVFKAKGN